MKQLNTIDEVLAALDGPRNVADLLGYKWTSRITNWRRQGFPPYTFLMLQAALAERQLTASASLWRMIEPAGWTFRMVRKSRRRS